MPATKRTASQVPARWSSPAFVWGVAALGLLVMLAFFVWVAWGFRDAAFAAVERQAENIASLVGQEVGRDVELYSLSLEAVLDGIKDPEVMSLPPRLRQLALFDRSAAAQGLGALVVMDRAGNIILDSHSYPPRRGNFSDREYFRFQRDAPKDPGLYFSKPFHARLQGRAWSISVSRRISAPDGSFAGIVHVTVNLDYLRRRFQQVLLGSKGSISLFRTDGIMLARTLDGDSQVGKDWHDLPLFQYLKKSDTGGFHVEATIDGVSRTYAYRRVGNLPLVVAVGESDKEALAPWRAKVRILAFIYVMMAVSVLGLTGLFVRELQRRRNAEQQEAIRARRDGLTELTNRRGFDEALVHEWTRATRSGTPLSVAMIDVDRFKDFNDEYGHLEGDRILKAVAGAIASACQRPQDVVARYGGEEIAALLPGTDQQGATVVGERIAAFVRALKIPHRCSAHGIVTVSVGLATLTTIRNERPDCLIRLADTALYYAKNTGRNKVSASNVTSLQTASRTGRPGAGVSDVA
ncbi:MAG TPA: sensor domain-containing diguanylate cyclase [Sphingomicrobium sp.]|nr:sensor domain-containing diguanylate cyclase [Sphingomicrobium sp.]